MNLIRKALWPTALVGGLLLFMGAIGGSAVQPAYANDSGDVCSIQDVDGNELMGADPTVIFPDVATDYTAYIDSVSLLDVIGSDLFDNIDQQTFIGGQIGTYVDVNLDDKTGDSDITSVDKDGDMKTEKLNSPTDHLNAVTAGIGDNVCGPTDDEIIAGLSDDLYAWLANAVERGEVCSDQDDFFGTGSTGPSTWCQTATPPDNNGDDNIDYDGIQDADIDCGYVPDNQCSIPGSIVRAAADAMASAMFSDGIEGYYACDYGQVADLAVQAAGATEFVGSQFHEFIADSYPDGGYYEEQPCIFPFDIGVDPFVTVDVTCDVPGEFDLSFAPEVSIDLDFNPEPLVKVIIGDPGSIEVHCAGDVDDAAISALPGSVEIIPAFNNVSHSLITVKLVDVNDDPAYPGNEVLFTTDRCSIETSGVDTADEYNAASSAFKGFNVLVAGSSLSIEGSDAAQAAVDGGSRQQDEALSFDNGKDTVAAAVLGCNPIDAPGATPGTATVTAYIDKVGSGDDIVISTTVTVVGPVVADGITVTASPVDLICGEKATVQVDLKDAAGQPVSDHTLVEAVTNYGGILGGTGAVAGGFGPTSPVSSTVAETFDGTTTFYLLTSDAHEGPYEVVVTTGGASWVSGFDHSIYSFYDLQQPLISGLLGGYLTSAPLSVQVTVNCSQPAPTPAPEITAPNTGGGITPPNTGDAGLASSRDGGVNLFVVAGAVALVVAAFGVLTPKIIRR